jgi:hypothetical protein
MNKKDWPVKTTIRLAMNAEDRVPNIDAIRWDVLNDYKAAVMRRYSFTTDEEYSDWVIAGNTLSQDLRGSIAPTMYSERVCHALGLSRKEWGQKVRLFDPGRIMRTKTQR